MATEIERKFLLVSDEWKAGVIQTYSLKDGLLARFGEGKVRIRHQEDWAFITVKGPRSGISRAEYEYKIPLEDAEELLSLCQMPHIEKIRHIVPYAGLNWAIDIHLGPLAGIEFAEVELAHPEQPITLPPWIGEEVTHDPRYRKATLLKHRAAILRAGS
ncbi:CYTH domain-containing protein [Siccirubricoccus deserti]|uniref:CYTH domain-containing protein n=1 Tax=Siccirubricoccus deserti TaxID=2013562 RepID=A0A9X0UDB0_9PROT|nr:CYTH domain-containing protein [Siccirubricoccus deserti]MBC4015461.1 CYTH domain-containing protein [Siccirubricoccus deserti]GGC41859.1 CYTH domain-containing protein [Siccirubricoccus deserti]